MKIFLSYSYCDGDRDLAQKLERLLGSHDMFVAKGKPVSGGQLTDQVRQRIESSDGLLALMTRRDSLGDTNESRWQTHPWVRDEYSHARAQNKHVIALVESGVETEGAYANYERIELDREHPLEAFLALSETLRAWRDEVGVQRVVQIRPDSLGQLFRTSRGLRCRYRFISREGTRSSWVEAEPVLQASGTLLYLRGVRDDDALVEVEILQDESMQWWSRATSQFISVEMQGTGAAE